jgi:sirohydrochlorin ferrochelatase
VTVHHSHSGVLLVAHGTRDRFGLSEVQTLSAEVADAVAPWPVETGFIELAEPTIGRAFDRLIQRGARRVRVVPLLLFAAGHAKVDLPQTLWKAAEVYKNVEISAAPPFGLDERISALSRRRFVEALSGRPHVATDKTYWLLVGRGSSDTEATAEFGRFAQQQARRVEIAQFSWSFVAAARPTLEAGLELAADSAAQGLKRIVVQPHLLFHGAVLDKVSAAVARWRTKCPNLDWVPCAHLGPEQELVDAVIERVTGFAVHSAGRRRA